MKIIFIQAYLISHISAENFASEGNPRDEHGGCIDGCER